MVTTKQKPVVDTQKIKRKVSKFTTMENHQFTKEDGDRGIKELQNSQKTNNKMTLVSAHKSIITLM